jgi:hypothetical protein
MTSEDKSSITEDVKRIMDKVTGAELEVLINNSAKAAFRDVLKEYSPEDQKALTKSAIKEVATEWMDRKLAEVGKWTVGSLAVLFVVALLYVTAYLNGWRPH